MIYKRKTLVSAHFKRVGCTIRHAFQMWRFVNSLPDMTLFFDRRKGQHPIGNHHIPGEIDRQIFGMVPVREPQINRNFEFGCKFFQYRHENFQFVPTGKVAENNSGGTIKKL